MSVTTVLELDVQATAQRVADLLPTAAALTVAPAVALSEAVAGMPPDAVAVHAAVVGERSGTVLVVVDRELAGALAQSPVGPLPLVEALRPALEALRSAFGVGAVGQVLETTPAGVAPTLSGQETTVVPLQGPSGVSAWLAVGVVPTASPGLPSGPRAPLSGAGLELLQDVVMELSAELGRTTMTVRELLSLQPGAVVELDRLAGSPADLLVNGRLIARGEVVVVDEDYALKITELVSGSLDTTD